MTFSKTLLRVAGWLFALSAPLSLPAYDLALEEIASGFVEPAQVTGARDGGGRVFVVELGGTVRIVWPDGSVDAEPFLDLRGRVDFLYSIAFHPDYASNGRFFVYERETVDDDVESYILEMRVDPANPDAADPTFERVVMMLQRGQPGVGGLVEFGPDGMLYVGVGDNEVSANGQDRSNVLGKILRIDIDSAIPYAIPPIIP